MTALDTIVAKFRKQSPNVAAAFDEVQRRLTVLEKPVVVPPPVTPPPPVVVPPPPTTSVETITPAQFQALVKPGATIQNKKVTGSVGWNVPNVTLHNVEFSSVDLNPGADGARLLAVKARSFYIWGVNGWEIGEGSLFDGQLTTPDCKLWDKGGVVGDNWAVRDSTFRNFMAPAPEHCQAIYIGSSTNGIVERNHFDNNGNTAHLFVTTFGNNAITAGAKVVVPSVNIRGNTFGATYNGPLGQGAYFSVNIDPVIPVSAKVYVQPGQPTVAALCARPEFVRNP